MTDETFWNVIGDAVDACLGEAPCRGYILILPDTN